MVKLKLLLNNFVVSIVILKVLIQKLESLLNKNLTSNIIKQKMNVGKTQRTDMSLMCHLASECGQAGKSKNGCCNLTLKSTCKF